MSRSPDRLFAFQAWFFPSHPARFDGSNLAARVYFYRLKAGETVASKKIPELK
jgi:hypothetical protein